MCPMYLPKSFIPQTEKTIMRSKLASLNPLLILFTVALVSVLFVVACGGSDDDAGAPADVAAEVTAAGVAAETAAAAEAAAAEAAEMTAAELAAAELAADLAQIGERVDVVTDSEEAEVTVAVVDEAGGPQRGGTLTVTMMPDFGSLDPHFTYGVMDQAVTQALYDNLLMIQWDGSAKPELAVSWEANDDLSSYTFKLRKGVKFHHGKDFSAEDVLWTMNRILDPVLDSSARTSFSSSVKDIVALDDYTVRFDLVGPNAFFLGAFTLPQLRMMPSDLDPSRILTTEDFGTGPFYLEDIDPGVRTVMARFDDYWEEGKPYLDEYILMGIREPAIRAEALKRGDVDAIYDLSFANVETIESHPDTVVLEAPGSGWIGFNMMNDRPPFDNKKLRQAFQAATDRELIRQAALMGRGVIAHDSPVPTTDALFAPQHKAPDYDPELARQLLAEAGYPDGIDIDLWTADVGAGMIDLAVAFKESAAPAGIRVNIQRTSPDLFWEESWMQKPFHVTSWAGRPNPDLALAIEYFSGASWNGTMYDNTTMDNLVIRARGEQLEDQKATYAEIQRILIDDAPRIVPVFKPMLYGARTNLRGIEPHPLAPMVVIFQDAYFVD